MARRKDKRVRHPHWRPDFRDAVLLPDVKVVRTQFLSNFLTFVAAVALLGVFLFNEHNLRMAESELALARSEIADGRAENSRFVRMSGDFTREARYVEQLTEFLDVPFRHHDLLASVGQVRPRAVTYNILSSGAFVERQGRREVVRHRVQLQGTVRELSNDPASAAINRFRDRLSELEAIAPKLEEHRLSSFYRTEDPSLFNFTVQIVIDPQKE